MSETVTPHDDAKPAVTPPPEDRSPPPTPAAPGEKPAGSAFALLALLLALIAAAIAAWGLWQVRQLHEQSSAQGAALEQTGTQARDLRERNAELDDRLSALPTAEELEDRRRQLVQLQGDQQHLMQQFNEVIGKSRQQWRLAEAEHLLRMATLRLTALEDTGSALALLQSADDILAAQNDPAAMAARQALAQSKQALLGLPKIDRTGLYLELGALRDQAARLQPLPAEFKPAGSTPPDENAGTLARWWHASTTRLSAYFRLSTDADKPVRPMLAEQSLARVRLSLTLALEQAQWAVINGESAVYTRSLQQAQEVLREFFDNGNGAIDPLLNQLDGLAKRPVSVSPPDLTPTLETLQAYIARRQGAAPSSPGAPTGATSSVPTSGAQPSKAESEGTP